MARPKIPLAARRSERVQVQVTRDELSTLDRRRGPTSRSEHLARPLREPYDLRALTVLQPWASLIAQGRKPWENRTRDPGIRHGRWVAVHAGKRLHARLDWARDVAPDVDPHELPTGAILGLVWMEPAVPVSAVTTGQEWACGPMCIPCSLPIMLDEPIPCRGKLGLWRVGSEILAAIEEQVGPL